MKIAVIAAQGRSGQVFVRHALAEGHHITAGILGKSNFAEHKHLTCLQCDATLEADVRTLLTGQDAVAVFIGHVQGSPADVQTKATGTILSAMEATGVTRIVTLTGTGVRFPDDSITLIDRILNLAVSVLDRPRVKDGVEHVRILQLSDAEWTVIRVLKLENITPQPFTLSAHGPAKTLVSRDEVAKAFLDVLTNHSFVHEAPIISPLPRH